MAALMILLGAVDLGLGALFFGFAPERIEPFRAAFGVPPEFNPIGAVSVGYAETAADPGGSAPHASPARSAMSSTTAGSAGRGSRTRLQRAWWPRR